MKQDITVTKLWEAVFKNNGELMTTMIVADTIDEAIRIMKETIRWRSDRYNFVSLSQTATARIAVSVEKVSKCPLPEPS